MSSEVRDTIVGLHGSIKTLQADRDALKAEVARLHEAMKKVRPYVMRGTHIDYATCDRNDCNCAGVQIIDAALKRQAVS